MGRIVSIEPVRNGKGGRRGFFHHEVAMDVQVPLFEGMCVQKEFEKYWVDIRDERIPDFRFTCGVIGHVEKSCDSAVKKSELMLINPSMVPGCKFLLPSPEMGWCVCIRLQKYHLCMSKKGCCVCSSQVLKCLTAILLVCLIP